GMGKVPDGFDTGLYQTVSNFGGLRFRDRKRRNLHIIFYNKGFQILHAPDLNSTHHESDEPGVNIEHPLYDKTALFKISVIGNSLSQISCSDDNNIMLPVNAQYLCDLCIKILYIIAIALLPESAEIIQILPDLRCRDLHPDAQFIRRNPLYAKIGR